MTGRLPTRLVFCTSMLVSISLLVAGCGDDFDPRWLVNKTRILAIKADNPRMDPGEFVTLSALVVSEDDNDPISMSWELCPFTTSNETGFECRWPEGTPDEVLVATTGDRATFSFFYAPQILPLVDVFCEQREELLANIPEGITLPDCTGGFPARVKLTVLNEATGEQAVAVKTLYLVPSEPAENLVDNRNPRIVELVEADEERQQPQAGEPFTLRCGVDVDSLEYFVRQTESEESLEEVQIAWFVRGGELEDARTFFSLVDGDPEDAQDNVLTPDEAGDVTVWCVIRDGRGGSDWKRLDLVATP